MSRTTRTLLITTVAAVLLAGCSSHPKPTAGGTTPPATSPPAAAPATSAAQSGALSGTWSGQYGGSYQGTFVLIWQESGSNLTGTINLSNPPGELTINGTVNGGTISFGTVGSAAIQYSGSISGNSMSGTYQVADGAGGHGDWSASRKS